MMCHSRSRSARRCAYLASHATLENLETRRLLAIVVNTTDHEFVPNATTSLGEALQQAADNPGDDIITFDPIVFDLAGAPHTISPLGAPLQIPNVGGKVTIVGPGRDVLWIDGSNSGRSFDLPAGAVGEISGLTIKNGVGAGIGGGIYNQGTLTLDDVLLTNNSIVGSNGTGGTSDPGSDGIGGAIYNTGTLTISDSTLDDNHAKGGNGAGNVGPPGDGGDGLGGAIWTSGALTVTSTTFSGNVAAGGTGGVSFGDGGRGGDAFGGAIYAADTAVVKISTSDFDGNAANDFGDAYGGGGSFASGGNGGDGWGGGIYSKGSLTLNDSSMVGNDARGGFGGASGLIGGGSGGSAYAGALYSDGQTDVDTVEFFSNSALGGDATFTGGANSTEVGGIANGGAIYLDPNARGSITGSMIQANNATGGLGGAADDTHNGGAGGGASGGAAQCYSDDFAFEDNTFNLNVAQGGKGGDAKLGGIGGYASGGAIYFSGKASVSGGEFTSNKAIGGDAGFGTSNLFAGTAYGGAINSDANLTLDSISFTTNQAIGGNSTSGFDGDSGTGNGGAIASFGTINIAKCYVGSNTALSGDSVGGAANTATGGGIYTEGGALTMSDTTVTINGAFVGEGGTGALGTVNGRGATGGGMYAGGFSTTITNSTIDHNFVAAGDGNSTSSDKGGWGGNATGGGLYVGGNVHIVNSTIYGNQVTAGSGGDTSSSDNGGDSGSATGGGIYSDTSQLNLINVTIASNLLVNGTPSASTGGGSAGASNDSFGGGLYNTAPGHITNTIVSDNLADVGPDVFDHVVAKNSLIFATAGAIFDAGSAGNITGQDPLLGSLTDNGGITSTALPDDGSPAVNNGDNALALLEFGAGGFDQRGTGFPRFNGVVDIGAVEVAGVPEIEVSGNNVTIANNDTTPSFSDFTNFGTTNRAAAALTRTFKVTNTGGQPLDLSSPNLPAGYTLIEALSSSIAPGASDTFTVGLTTPNAGTIAGNISIATNDPDVPNFVFKVTGVIDPKIKINFQPAAAAVPDTFVADSGLVFAGRGNGLTYGWNQNSSSGTRDREVLSDQAKDTLVHTQLYGVRTWEIAVPNGSYQVHIVSGDASYFNSVYKLAAEGTLVVNGTPTSGSRFVEGTKTVTVSDGKLTITNAAGAVNNKIDYVEITPVSPPPPPPPAVSVKVNFQTASSSTPSGYFADSGAVFGNRGNGQSYGWNLGASSFSRDRNAGNSADQKHDTFIHTQLYGVRTWELAVPNGSYQVHLGAGDPSFFDSVYKYNLEGTLALNGTPSSGNRWIEGTITVAVSDGKLTLTNAAGSVNNKIDYIEVTST